MPDDPAAKPQTLKILHLNAGNMMGGVETVLLAFAEFAKTCPEFQQEFAVVFDGAFSRALRATGAAVQVLPEAQLRNPLSVFETRRALRRLLRERGYDGVVSHSPWCQAIYAPAAKRLKVPVIFWMHNLGDGHWLQRLASRHSPRLAICNSAFTRSTLPMLYPHSPSRIIFNPVRPLATSGAGRDELRKQIGTAADVVVILMASRMDAWKGHLNLLRAVAEIRTESSWEVWIAGAPQTPTEEAHFMSVQSEIGRLGLGNRIRLLGQRSDVAALMRAADIYCQPNNEPEPFGVVFVEALQAGVPVVTYAMGGAQEILDARAGILVPPGNLAGLREVLLRLMQDATLRSKLGAAGPERARSMCDPAGQIRKTYEILLPACTTD